MGMCIARCVSDQVKEERVVERAGSGVCGELSREFGGGLDKGIYELGELVFYRVEAGCNEFFRVQLARRM